MTEVISIVCRACGAPLGAADVSTALSCRHCGSNTPLDAATGGRLRRHAAHVRRADQKVRAVVRHHVIAGLLPQLVGKAKLVAYVSMFVGFGSAIAFPIVPLLVGVALKTDFETYVLPLFAVGMVVGCVVLMGGFAFAMVYGYKVGIKAEQTASTVARSCATRTTTTQPTKCSRCGGFASMVVVGDMPSLPCPWCQTPLVSAGGDMQRAAMDAVVAEWQATGDARLQQARIQAGLTKPRREAIIQGFVKRAGIYEGQFGPVAIWGCGDLTEFGLLLRVEAHRELPLEGCVWFLPRGGAETYWKAMAAFGVHPPEQRQGTDPQVDARFEVFADPTVSAARVAAHPGIRAMLLNAGPSESLTLDEAGGACWSLMPTNRLLSAGFEQFLPSRAQALAAAVVQMA